MVVVKAARRLKDRISLCTSSKEALEEEEKKRKEENKESLKGKRRKEGALACEDPCEVEEMPALVVEEEVETSKKKKKRREEEGPENPFHLAPNKYTRSVLGVVEPFLCIDDSGTMPHFNKFTPWQMHEGALTQAISYMAAHISLVEETMGAAGTTKTEGNLRPYLMSLLCPFKLMTRPSAEEYSALQINMRGKKIEDYIQDTAEDDVTDLVITCPENDQEDAMALQKGSLSSSNEGLDIDHEAAPQGEDNIKKQGRTDFRVFVRDKRIMKRELPKKKLRELQTKRLVAVVESKFVEEEGAVFQAVAYARHEVLRNLQNMHVEPVYLVVVAASRWTYAILDVHSSLRLDDNRITAEAFSDYLEIQRLQSEGEDRGHSESDLKLRLNEKIKSLKDGYKMSKFLNKKYLVGDLYLCHQWYDLPTALRGSGFASSGACLFFEGFMRIIVGNRVLKWHESDVDKVYNIRNTFMHLGQKFRGGLDIKL